MSSFFSDRRKRECATGRSVLALRSGVFFLLCLMENRWRGRDSVVVVVVVVVREGGICY